ncbi:MBL fold metallo-hydrolase [bacterium]|nr:MBL fold metallo-hydrolase [bacterium]
MDPADQPKILTLADGIHVRQAIDNMGWIDMGGHAVVVDALEHAELEAEVFDAIADTLGDVPVRTVLNTHSHYDHIALNPAFQRRCTAAIVGMPTTHVPPEGLWFEGTKRRLQFLPMPGCHTAEDCVAWLPEDRVLFAGDLFGWGIIPLVANLRAELFDRLVAMYERLIAFEPQAIVGGHGPLFTVETLERFIAYLHELRESIGAACRGGQRDAAIVAAHPPPDDMCGWWRFVAWKHDDTVRKILKAVRRGALE